jgi:hypothetical protein
MKVVPMEGALWNWFNSHLPILAVEDTEGMVMLRDDNTPIAGFVMDNWTHNSVQGHFLLLDPMALRNKFYDMCASYIFDERQRAVIYSFVPGDNPKAISLNIKFGWTEKFRMEEAFKEGVDYVVMELKKEDCKYISWEALDGQKIQQTG